MKTTRRKFSALALGAAALPLLPADIALAQPADTPAAPDALAEALTGVVRAEYGQFLSGDELEKVAQDFKEWVPAIRRLREFPLTNADEPDFAFSAVGANDAD